MAATVIIDRYAFLSIMVVLFGIVGLIRGISRELLSMAGIGLAIWVSKGLAAILQPNVNRFYKLGRFALSGGLTGDDPAAAWRAARELPDLIRTPTAQMWFIIGVFVAIVLFFYLWGEWYVAGAKGLVPMLLGLIAGGINGFLITYFIFPLLFEHPSMVITLPSQEVAATLSSSYTLAWVMVFFVVMLIAFGLYNAGRPKRK